MRSALILLLFLTTGCGYHLVHGARAPLGPFAIVAGPVRVPDAALAAAAEEGARAELSRAGELGAGERGTVEIEILRADETGEAIAQASPGPLARAVRVTVFGRARLRGPGVGERDTGEVRATEVFGSPLTVSTAAIARDEAGRAAARRLGEILVRRLLGIPEPGDP